MQRPCYLLERTGQGRLCRSRDLLIWIIGEITRKRSSQGNKQMLMVILWFIPALTALATPGSCVLYTVQISRDQDINRRPELHSVLVVDNLYDLMMQQSVQSCIASISHLTSPQNIVSSHHFYLQKNKRFWKSLMRNSSFIFVHNNTSKTVYFAFLFNYRKENLLSRRLRKTEKTSIFCICKKMKLKKKNCNFSKLFFVSHSHNWPCCLLSEEVRSTNEVLRWRHVFS